MTVYVDLLFAVNAVINYLLLRGSAAMGGFPARRRRLWLAAAVGGLYAVAAVLPEWGGLAAMPGQALCAALMLLLAFGWKRATVKQGLFFLALSFAFGGAVLLAVQLLEPDLIFLGGRAYYAVSTPALLLLAGLCYGLAAVVLAGWGTHTGGDVAAMKLTLNGRTAELQALRDTGNTLRDPVTGQGVLVVQWQVLARLLPEAGLEAAQFQDPAGLMERLAALYPQLRFRLVPYRAVGVAAGLLLAVRCQGAVKGRKEDILAAFSPTEVSAGGRFEALLGGVIT